MFFKTKYRKIFVSKCGVIHFNSTHRLAKPFKKQYLDKDGYFRIWINVRDDQPNKFIPVHRVVADTFIKKPSALHVVNHKDGNRKNNFVSNLEWLLPAENERHARAVLGKRLLGEKASRSKLDSVQVLKIRFLKSKGQSLKKISEQFSISLSQVTRIIKRINWGHI